MELLSLALWYKAYCRDRYLDGIPEDSREYRLEIQFLNEENVEDTLSIVREQNQIA
ncbi:hypothetical protein [Enterococcus hulanensis]|uniref:hypothetical protein n=1 Tax=Enterococcus hulanensis TaxID=2559929 RepID=UPI0028BDD48E|nr:hypothetical protein [Enterococcus hulanensis]